VFIKELKRTDKIIVLTECLECGEEREHIVFLNSEEWEFQYNKGIICCKNCKKAFILFYICSANFC